MTTRASSSIRQRAVHFPAPIRGHLFSTARPSAAPPARWLQPGQHLREGSKFQRRGDRKDALACWRRRRDCRASHADCGDGWFDRRPRSRPGEAVAAPGSVVFRTSTGAPDLKSRGSLVYAVGARRHFRKRARRRQRQRHRDGRRGSVVETLAGSYSLAAHHRSAPTTLANTNAAPVAVDIQAQNISFDGASVQVGASLERAMPARIKFAVCGRCHYA